MLLKKIHILLISVLSIGESLNNYLTYLCILILVLHDLLNKRELALIMPNLYVLLYYQM